MFPHSRDPHLTMDARRQQELPGAIKPGADTRIGGDIRGALCSRGSSQRGRGRGGRPGISRTSQLPLSTSAAVLGRTRQATVSPWNTQQSGISSPIDTSYQNYSSGSISSRKLSAGFTTNGPPSSQPTTGYSTVTASTTPQTSTSNHPGPLTSHPTTAYSSMVASGSRGSFDRYAPGPLRQSQTTGNLPPPSAYTQQKGGLQTSRTLLPVPESSGATTSSSVTASTSGVIPRFGAENINPYLSEVDLGRRHRDSLEISSTKKIPKRTPPNAKRKVISDVSNTEPIPELPEQILQTVKQKNTEKNAEQKVPTSDKPPFQQQPPLQQPQAQQLPKQTFPSADCINSIDLARIHPLPPQLPPPMPVPNPKPKKQSGIPKSRTLNVLSNLTSSFSRASLSSSNNNKNSRSDLRRQIGSPIMASNTFDGNASLTENDSSLGANVTPNQASTPAPALATMPVHRNPRMVYNAETQSYWTGRFVAMQDKLRNENLKGQSLNLITTSMPGQQQPQAQAPTPKPTPTPAPVPAPDAALRTSYSMACMPGVTPQLLSGEIVATVQAASEMTDEDTRIRRVFRHLEALCANRSALDSMHEFQQDYARLVGKKGLLPPGSSWDDKDKDKDKKGWVGRIFSGNSSSGSSKKKANGSQ
ncbi:hypothetical protein F4813DRAFT_396962 [Daldinia decipiens]|uniref:uncharacterized protein n=1 Tax=Daldinia decipiens TaxID=326647 RepID=UPI0020C40FB0|nr:uncharacterized protein F4813DRAFT_396962 [Daldinia decipiens]KAI1662316.1 hypothetical protein F4813DRAFT_396962 [Daldinia decipiens]